MKKIDVNIIKVEVKKEHGSTYIGTSKSFGH